MSSVAPELAAGSFEFLVDGVPRAGIVARQKVRDRNGAFPASLRDDLLLLLTELVTNAVRHSGMGPEQSVSVALSWREGRVRTEVGDPGRTFTRAQARPARSESGGMGLIIVDRLAQRWGVTRTPTGTSVWCEIGAEE